MRRVNYTLRKYNNVKWIMLNRTPVLMLFVVIFMVSGFSGLIYESIWSHYLKLFLGHSSYAQVLVLVIFMGGLAVGSAIASKLSARLKNLILCYAIVECIIGFLGIGFHALFTSVEAYAFDSLFPALGVPWLVTPAKWLLASLLIIPQSILLGATFPFMAAGITRRFPVNTGSTLSVLYFANSFGAALGILFNAFWLIPNIGLPGAILTAGIINVCLALVVYFLSRNDNYEQPQPTVNKANNSLKLSINTNVLLYLAAATGLASFMYEIGWIRMLSMVLGSSTHAFELMLSAFILGLAIGGLWIRKRIDNLENPIQFLAYIQIAMGAFAALTIPLYNATYELMGFTIDTLRTNDNGYFVYTLLSYGISLLVMLPASICAGTTLPLITYILLKANKSDAIIGKVYAFNTIGSITGIVLAVLFVMPLFGLKWVVLGGAILDFLLGIALLLLIYKQKKINYIIAISSLASVVLFSSFNINIDNLASGVFRYGSSGLKSDSEIIFHKDGMASSVSVKEYKSGSRILINNGKPDAGLYPTYEDGKISGDTPTMILLGALPFVYNSDASLIANIGLGSGLTAHTILHSPTLERLDSIEIEQEVVNAAQLFRPRVDKLFTDKRSNIVIDDAKTYFSTHSLKYDVIVSEPPNPWVSGVSSLFSEEFYQQITRYLKGDGQLVQWLHLYEISPELIATVYNALRTEFDYVHMYQVGNLDIAIVASKRPLQANPKALFEMPDMMQELDTINIKNENDINIRLLAKTTVLDPVFQSFNQANNSDYFPILDIGANRSRFKRDNSKQLLTFRNMRLLMHSLGEQSELIGVSKPFDEMADNFFDGVNGKTSLPVIPTTTAQNDIRLFKHLEGACNTSQYLSETEKKQVLTFLYDTSLYYIGGLSNDENLIVLDKIKGCSEGIGVEFNLLVNAYYAWFSNDYENVLKLTEAEVTTVGRYTSIYHKHVLKLYLASGIKLNRKLDLTSIYLNTPTRLIEKDLELAGLFEAVYNN